jgi:hypothetical protein
MAEEATRRSVVRRDATADGTQRPVFVSAEQIPGAFRITATDGQSAWGLDGATTPSKPYPCPVYINHSSWSTRTAKRFTPMAQAQPPTRAKPNPSPSKADVYGGGDAGAEAQRPQNCAFDADEWLIRASTALCSRTLDEGTTKAIITDKGLEVRQTQLDRRDCARVLAGC